MSCIVCWEEKDVISLQCFPTHILCRVCISVLERKECPLCKKSFAQMRELLYLSLLWRIIGVYIYNIIVCILDEDKTLKHIKKNFNINIDFFLIYPLFSSLQIIYISFIKDRNVVFVAIANIIWLPIICYLFTLILAIAVTIIASIEQMNVLVLISVLLSVDNSVKLLQFSY